MVSSPATQFYSENKMKNIKALKEGYESTYIHELKLNISSTRLQPKRRESRKSNPKNHCLSLSTIKRFRKQFVLLFHQF